MLLADFGQEWGAGGGVVDAGGGDGHSRQESRCVGVVLSVLTGEIRSGILDDLPVDGHTFDPNDELLGG
ncbi:MULTISPECIES: hypothetical protein [unclassified Streptomyces]|uniref:hypothetical protein n=1 Tax=unclassified Streptomyces TaxID=2593676 RepID=UPI0018FE09BD|nr:MULTISPECIES: hypothetical protein [unclassified Streptomyces]